MHRRAQEESMAFEAIETQPFVAAKISGFGSNEDAGTNLRHERGGSADGRLSRPYPGDTGARNLGHVEKIEGSDDTIGDYLFIRGEHQVDAILADRLSACLVDPAPMRLGLDRQPEWSICSIEQAVSHFE